MSEKGDCMFFKRGVISGVFFVVVSLSLLYDGFGLFYGVILILGIIQLVVSINYQTGYKRHILLICFGLEGFYYIIAIVHLLKSEASLGEIFLGIVALLGIGTLIVTAIYELYHQINGK